ncbi:MAG: hypothetical protein DRP82_00175, partial [Planctomycetota bacterium]
MTRSLKAVAAALVMILAVAGCSSRSKKKPSGGPVTADFVANPTYGVAPLTVSFTNKSTGNPTSWEWDFNNDGIVDSTDRNPRWTYNNPGVYTVRLKVTGSGGSDVCIRWNYICVRPSGGALKADFAASPPFIRLGQTVQFHDLSGGSPTSWEWDFDNDGTVDSTSQDPQWTPTQAGWYTVKLTVSDGTNTDTCVKMMCVLVANNIYYVDSAAGDDANTGEDWSNAWKTLEFALSQTNDYDLVLVADATYKETNLNFNGKKVYLKGVDRNTAGRRPVIDCQSGGRAFIFNSGEAKESVIDNLTIRNGKVVDDEGGAMVCENGSSPTIINCVFENNTAVDSNNSWNDHGGALFCNDSSPTIMNCVFSNNHADIYGGAIHCSGGNCAATIINCVFDGNSGYQGGAFSCSGAAPQLHNCTFCNNSSVNYGGGGAVFVVGGGAVTILNSILWGNIGPVHEIAVYDDKSSCTLMNCCIDASGVYSNAPSASCIVEDSCIYSDPLFVDAAGGDYHLQDASPCIDAGDSSFVPNGVDSDLDGNARIVDGDNDGTANVDIGAYEFQSSAQPLQIITTTLLDATEGVSYSEMIKAAGGTPPYTWTVSGLPSGLSWSQVGDIVEISGTPDSGTAGTYSVDVTVTDSSSPNQSASVTLQLVVNSGGAAGDWYVDALNG